MFCRPYNCFLMTCLISSVLGIINIVLDQRELELAAAHVVRSRELQSLETDPANANHQPYRTGYHFQPPKNWMNDPNGPMIHKGVYHLFYQYNPKGAVWGNIVWAHSTSSDLVNWTPHPIAIYPTQESDINGCWSGSTTIIRGNKPVILYTGINPRNEQVQNLATPKNLSDKYLVEWIKSPHNPLMSPNDRNMINATSFRDPTTAWLGPDGKWRVIIGSKRERNGIAILYRSKDFVKWVEAEHPLYSSSNGSGMWECPDFYPVSVENEDGVDTSEFGEGTKHVFKASLNDVFHDAYVLGRYDVRRDVFKSENGPDLGIGSKLRYDYGKFYASKTFFDGSRKRRILWGWVNESTDAAIDVSKGWSGLQAIPRKIWLDRSGKQLVQWPIEEIEKLRTNKVVYPRTVLKGGSVLEIRNLTASQADVEIEFEISTLENAELMDPGWDDPQEICSQRGASVKGMLGPFGLLVLASKDVREHTAVFFRVFRTRNDNQYAVLMCSDQSRSSLHVDYDKTTYGAFVDLDPVKETLPLRSLIDHSIVESFGGEGKSCITARVYPSVAIDGNAHLFAFNNGTESINVARLSAWSMKKAHIN